MSAGSVSLPAGAAATSPAATKSVNKWAVAVAVATGALLEVIDTSIVNVALTDIQAAVGATLSQVSWVVSSYAVANVIVLPMSAWLGQRFGKKRYFVFSLIGFTLASMLCGMATSLEVLIFARTLQGLMGGGLLSKAQAFLYETFPPEEQATAQAAFGAVVIAGPVFGPTIGGYITTHSDWRWIFFVNLPVGIAAVLLCLQALPKDEPADESTSKVDWLGIGLLVLGLGSLQTMLEEGNSDGWFDSLFITSLACLSVAGMAAFVWRELSTDHPIVDLRVLRYRSLTAGSMLSIIIGVALYGAMFAVPIFAQSILHFTSQQTGLLMMPGAIMSAVSMQVAGRLSRRFDPRRVLFAGGMVLVGSLVWIGSLSVNTGEGDLFGPLLLRAFGTALMFVPLNLASIGPIPRHDVAKATGIFNLTRQLGGSIGVALLSTILDRRMVFHRSIVSSHLSVDDPHVMERLNQLTAMYASHGASEPVARQQALSTLYGMVQQQASVLSFNDTFYIVAGLVLLFMPLVFLLGKPPANAAVADAH